MSETPKLDTGEWGRVASNAGLDFSSADEAYYAGLKQGRILERTECWNAIQKWIKPGNLSGNGCDEAAQRNGMILAANIIGMRFSEV